VSSFSGERTSSSSSVMSPITAAGSLVPPPFLLADDFSKKTALSDSVCLLKVLQHSIPIVVFSDKWPFFSRITFSRL